MSLHCKIFTKKIMVLLKYYLLIQTSFRKNNIYTLLFQTFIGYLFHGNFCPTTEVGGTCCGKENCWYMLGCKWWANNDILFHSFKIKVLLFNQKNIFTFLACEVAKIFLIHNTLIYSNVYKMFFLEHYWSQYFFFSPNLEPSPLYKVQLLLEILALYPPQYSHLHKIF